MKQNNGNYHCSVYTYEKENADDQKNKIQEIIMNHDNIIKDPEIISYFRLLECNKQVVVVNDEGK